MSTTIPLVQNSTTNSSIEAGQGQTAAPSLIAFTVALPPSTQAEIDGLIADARTAAQAVTTAAQKIGYAVQSVQTDVHTTAATLAAEIPLLQASIQEIADAVKNFRVL